MSGEDRQANGMSPWVYRLKGELPAANGAPDSSVRRTTESSRWRVAQHGKHLTGGRQRRVLPSETYRPFDGPIRASTHAAVVCPVRRSTPFQAVT